MSEPPSPLVELITTQFSALSPKQQLIARYLVDHPAEVAFTSANELAKRLDVNAATVVRLSRALGYSGYPELQRDVRKYFPHHYPALAEQDNQLSRGGALSEVVDRALTQDMENLRLVPQGLDVHVLDEVANVLLGARRVLLIGGGVASGVTAFLASSFRTIGFMVTYVTEGVLTLVQEIENLTEGDVVFGVAFYRYVAETLVALERTRELGVPSITLTDSPLSPTVPLATYALWAPVESTTHRISLVAPLAVANALLAVCVTRKEKSVDSILHRLDQQYRKVGALVFE